MTTLTTALDAEFTPAAGDFVAQVAGGGAYLMRKQTSGAAFVRVGLLRGDGVIVSNPVAGAIYKFVAADVGITPTVQADQ